MHAVSIVIPTRDRPESVRDAVQSILDGDRLPAELIVADQSSGRWAQLPTTDRVRIRHLRLSSVGASAARNAGIAVATGDVLVFADDDVRAAPDWCNRIVDALESAPPRTAVTGAVLADELDAGDGHLPSITARTAPQTFSGQLYADPLSSGNMALRRSAFDDVGLFDERLGAGARFPAAEDNDLGHRLLAAGYDIAFVPDAVLYHRGARRGRALLRHDWSYARGQGAFYAKHMSLSDRHMLRRFGRNAAFRLRRMTGLLRGDRAALRETVYLAGLISGTLGWLARYAARPAARAARAGSRRAPR